MLRLSNRKGIFVVLVGLLFMVLMGVAAMSIDMSRIWTMRNELQTAADAGALAGAIQLTPPHDTLFARDTATAFALMNKAQYSTVSVDSVQLGVWDDATQTFTRGVTPYNAVHVVVGHPTNRLIMGAFGIAAPRIRARSTAWAMAPVTETNCIKPWSIPYVRLMYVLNLARGIVPANSFENLTRPFDQVADMQALRTMSEEQRTFTLKMGSGSFDDGVPGSTMPGNYQAVKLPKYYDAETDTHYPFGDPGNGADDYRMHVVGATCHTLAVGDSLETKPGDMTGPTIQGAAGTGPVSQYDGICATLNGETNSVNRDDPSFGDCLDASGNPPTVKAAFHLCRSGCNGATKVSVEMLGSFTLKKIYPANSGPHSPTEFSKAEIVGVFNPIEDTGPVGSGASTLTRLILVR